MTVNCFEERDFLVRDLRIRVKLWNEESPCRIIALHGWLDNAASFDVIAPLLQGCAIAALDLPGQGFSDYRPPSATYHLWDDLLEILSVADQLGWPDFVLLGHSRGSMLSVMLAASCPERVRRLLLIDGLMPLPVEIGKSPQQLRSFLDDSLRGVRESRVFGSRQSAIIARAMAGKIPEHIAGMLAQRNLREFDNGWAWHVDNRLKAASAFKLSSQHNSVFLDAIKCPVGIFLASEGFGAYPEIGGLMERYPQFSWHKLHGHHHLHMDTPSAEIARLCLESLFEPC